jgi:F-type H+-transporting ATPase subunit delta
MKISAEKYAQTLYELTEEKSKDEIKKIIADFFRVLMSHNDLAKAEEIINELESISNKKEGIVDAKALSAIELSNDSVEIIKAFIKKKTGAGKVNITKEINKDLLGGTIIEYGDKILDLSLRARIKELKQKMIK